MDGNNYSNIYHKDPIENRVRKVQKQIDCLILYEDPSNTLQLPLRREEPFAPLQQVFPATFDFRRLLQILFRLVQATGSSDLESFRQRRIEATIPVESS